MKRTTVKISGTCIVPYIPVSPEALPASDGKVLPKSAMRQKETHDWGPFYTLLLKFPMLPFTGNRLSWSAMPRHGHYLFWFRGWGCFDICFDKAKGLPPFLSSCLSLRLKAAQISHKCKGTVWLSLHVCVGAKLHPELWGCLKLLLNSHLHHSPENVSILDEKSVPGARRPLLSMWGAFCAGNSYNTALMKKDTKEIWGKKSSQRWAMKHGIDRRENRALWWSWYLWG